MPAIRTLDMKLIDDAFAMHHGFPLDFSNRTFAEFFAQDLNVDIYDERYAQGGTSKANRLRTYLKAVDAATAVSTLEALWGYRKDLLASGWRAEFSPELEERFQALLQKMAGRDPTAHSSATQQARRAGGTIPTAAPMVDHARIESLRNELIALATLAAQPRGYAFEKLLAKLFEAYGLEAREAFRLRGEQIDGSFVLGHETYLLEAKWQSEPTGVQDLHAFCGKVTEKATWARGLFVSNTGFTDVGLAAFGRRKPIVCMDGLDLYDALQREIPLSRVLELKVRRAAETGNPFTRVRDLFPA